MTGPLSGLKIVEFAGIGPGPFCAMVLGDLGASVVRIARPGVRADARDVTTRNRQTVNLDLRAAGATEQALALVGEADGLIEGFRPGVMERLGLGPDPCLAVNPRLVYGRMTGWGQFGPLAHAAGHDINYIAITGALHAIGRADEAPPPPLNYVGDFGGGGMLLAVGLLAALLEARSSGRGQVVDAAMTDGTGLLSAFMYGMKALGQWSNRRGANLLDGAAHFYDTYACADGKFIAIGAIEANFYAELRQRCGIDDPLFDAQLDASCWPLLKQKLAELFRTRTRAAWCEILEGTDACFAPVLDWDEAPLHPHNVARGTYIDVEGITQPAPAPRFSRTANATPQPTRVVALDDALAMWRTASAAAPA
jgi:alpha-methylacyl-CoA racemase